MLFQVVGPMANNPQQLFGDYAAFYTSNVTKTPSQGLADVANNILYEAGCLDNKCPSFDKNAISTAVTKADMTVVCLGTGNSFKLYQDAILYWVFKVR